MSKKILVLIAAIFCTSIYFFPGCKGKTAGSESATQLIKTNAPGINSIIGKKYSSLNSIADWLTGGEEGFVCQNKNSSDIKIFYDVKDTNKRYLLMSKATSDAGAFEVTDIIEVNMSHFPNGSTIKFNNCKDINNTIPDCQYIAVYYKDETNGAQGDWIKPEKAWKPNAQTGEIEEVSADSIKCASEKSIEEPM